MTSPLENLTGPGKALTVELPDAKEFAGLKRSGLARLRDAANATLSLEGRFDLAYNAAHVLCLAALRHHGLRPANRYIVFQVLPHTLDSDLKCGACWPSVMRSAILANTKAIWTSMYESLPISSPPAALLQRRSMPCPHYNDDRVPSSIKASIAPLYADPANSLRWTPDFVGMTVMTMTTGATQ